MRAANARATARCGDARQKGHERCLTRETPKIFLVLSAGERARGSCEGRKGVRPLGSRVPGSKRTGLCRRLKGQSAFLWARMQRSVAADSERKDRGSATTNFIKEGLPTKEVSK